MIEKDDKIDCFARKNENTCIALTVKKCRYCPFFRRDLNRLQIENEIKIYRGYKGDFGEIDG